MDRREAISGLGTLLGGAIISPNLHDFAANSGKADLLVKIKSQRKKIVLSDNWKFQPDIKDIGEGEHWFIKDFNGCDWGKVQVPSPWDCYETALWEYEGIGWYMTTINPDDF